MVNVMVIRKILYFTFLKMSYGQVIFLFGKVVEAKIMSYKYQLEKQCGYLHYPNAA